MPSRDANNATWYVLRYREDFIAPAGSSSDPSAPFAAKSAPSLSKDLLFDESRGVLELQYLPSPFAAVPPPGLAVDPAGSNFRVDDEGTLQVILCDGSSRPFFCEPDILAQPAGLALDSRGYLYIADPAAGRVVVAESATAHVVAILDASGTSAPLLAPVDVAISSGGRIYVADRAQARVVIFTPGMKPIGMFETAGAPGKRAEPIAIWFDADGSLLLADAWLPRVLRYSPDGELLGDLEIAAHAAASAGLPATSRFSPRVAGDRGPCASDRSQGGGVIDEHRRYRVEHLTLGRRFSKSGEFVSRRLDGGRPGVPWHRVEVEFANDPPPGTRVLIETSTSDQASPASKTWSAPRDVRGRLIAYAADRADQLVISQKGRYLWVRATLESDDGRETPSIRAIRVWYPRVSWLDLLPTVYRRDPEAGIFLEHFLALFERVFTSVEDRYEEFSRALNPDAAPRDVIDWLAGLIDLAFDPSWSLEKRRMLVGEAMSLYRTRGTTEGIGRYVEIYMGRRPLILEDWLQRPARPAFLGRPGTVLGCGLPLLGTASSPAVVPDCDLWNRYAHRFTILVYLDDPCDADVTIPVVERIIALTKPAHTVHRIQAIYPEASVGLQCRVGLDLVLGDSLPMAMPLIDACGPVETPGRPTGVLGVDTVLSHRPDSEPPRRS